MQDKLFTSKASFFQEWIVVITTSLYQTYPFGLEYLDPDHATVTVTVSRYGFGTKS
ncbi:MAG: hypothetical protein ABIN36_13840 [Ferruginibacter sp.]